MRDSNACRYDDLESQHLRSELASADLPSTSAEGTADALQQLVLLAFQLCMAVVDRCMRLTLGTELQAVIPVIDASLRDFLTRLKVKTLNMSSQLLAERDLALEVEQLVVDCERQAQSITCPTCYTCMMDSYSLPSAIFRCLRFGKWKKASQMNEKRSKISWMTSCRLQMSGIGGTTLLIIAGLCCGAWVKHARQLPPHKCCVQRGSFRHAAAFICGRESAIRAVSLGLPDTTAYDRSQ